LFDTIFASTSQKSCQTSFILVYQVKGLKMKQRDDTPGAVVLGSDFKALGVVRSLGKRGIRCVVIDNTPRSAWFSRYSTQCIRWPGSMESTAFLDFLLHIGKQYHLEQWLLYPLQDEVVALVAQHTQQLSMIYQLVTQDWSVIRWANDKRLTYQMAQELGIDHPQTWYPADEEDLKRLAKHALPYPVIIKPAISTHLQYVMRKKALLASNSDELLAQYQLAASILPPDEILLQEIIPGNGDSQYSIATFCQQGKILLAMTARRSRQYPIDYGLSSCFVEAVEIPELLAPAARLLDYMQVSGMVEVEFKYDHHQRQYKLLDINVRPWGWHTLCIACGLDFPYIQYCSILGQQPATITPRYDYRWLRLLTDIPAGIQEMRAGITSPLAYLSSLRGKTTFSVFDWQDPLPALGDLAVVLSRSLKGFKGQ
jgi:predicted ATP-grasp superfamily ATP-dependent carboligase